MYQEIYIKVGITRLLIFPRHSRSEVRSSRRFEVTVSICSFTTTENASMPIAIQPAATIIDIPRIPRRRWNWPVSLLISRAHAGLIILEKD